MNTTILKKPSYDMIFNIGLVSFFFCVFSLNRMITTPYYLLAILGIYSIRQKNFQFKEVSKEAITYLGMIFLLVVLITLSILIYKPGELFKWHYAAYRDLILLPFVLAAFHASKIDIDKIYKMLVITSLVTIFWIIMIRIHHPLRWHGWLSQPINRGNIGMLAGMVSLTALVYFNDYRWKIIAAVGFFSGVLLSILSGSRGGWLALFVVAGTLLYQLSKTNKAAVKVLLASFVLVAIIVFIEWKNLPIEKRLHLTLNSLHEYFSGKNKATSIGARFEMWRASWYAFLDKPLFGWGWDKSDDYFQYFINKGTVQLSKSNFGHPHSQYFLFLGQMGLLGFITFISILIYPIQYFIRKITAFNKRANVTGVFICLLPLAIHEAVMEFSLSDDSLSKRPFLLILTTMTLFCISLITKAEQSSHPPS